MFTAILIIIIFIFILFINSASSLKSNWAFFYDTKRFRNFFPFKENTCSTIKHPLNKDSSEYLVHGFKHLFISPKSSYNRGIDTISLAKGDKNCKPCGYTNVDGNLCLSKCQIKSLQTRGKNDPDAIIDVLS
tara:strand:+ start:2409 stop:2804 length:396 start_codon:yes stop_codon:yes gene_type:complete